MQHPEALLRDLRPHHKGKGTRPGPPVHDDLTQRRFTAETVNTTWFADITEHHTGEGRLYLCATKDACARRIVGYAIGTRMKASLAVQALNNAVANRQRDGAELAGCLVHSDCGSQFRPKKFLRALDYYRLVGSMGRGGAAGDNATMESFFSLCRTACSTPKPGPPRYSCDSRL